MKEAAVDIFVTGGTACSAATIPLLTAAGHRVPAPAAPTQRRRPAPLGAEPVRTDLFDPNSVQAAVAGSDAILHLATRSLPPPEPPGVSAWSENDG
jgi:nucleoside-diphosphate-sugar epimerase